jgi:ribosomal protein S18 acetylase RimI-like enzyme
MNAIGPIPRCELSIREATLADVPFMDGLQKKYGRALGYFPTQQFEEYVESGGVLVAEATELPIADLRLPIEDKSQIANRKSQIGYVISRDRYLKRDELGVIYQLCVAPGTQRKLVGAMLVREALARSAYGCKLYCCWCAQDLEANYFWESMGFVPVAFRAGSDRKKRVHIFWQRRINGEDAVTPYWYPFTTNGGAIRADRLVFPIPPGVHWKDVQAVEVPCRGETCLALPAGDTSVAPTSGMRTRRSKIQHGPGPGQVAIVVSGRIKYVDRPGYVAPAPAPAPVSTAIERRAKAPRGPKAKIDRKYLKAARELRDRYLEQLNRGMILPNAKYDVARALPNVGTPWPIPNRRMLAA